MKRLLLFLLFEMAQCACAQPFVTKIYSYTESSDIVYGQQTDFAGNERILLLDVFLPANDTPPPCGRPLLVFVHGGAWMVGTKDDGTATAVCREFAQRGYVAASVNYRLGAFHTHDPVHCDLYGWDCYNQADSSECIRAIYRGMQDVKGAIRFLVKNAAAYQIDPRNVFVAGESAGGFIALYTGFLDLPSEKPPDCSALPDVLPPSSFAETNCIQAFGLDTSVASMNLSRPDLGSIDGPLHLDAPPYTIRGIGNIYGGILQNILAQQAGPAPAIYLYQQPNDLLVPYYHDRLATGFNYCAETWSGCSYIPHLPYAWGSSGIAWLVHNGLTVAPTPALRFDSTFNDADCVTQLLFPATAGHRIDSPELRSLNMATFFAAQLEESADCNLSAGSAPQQDSVWLYPNPATGGNVRIQGLQGTEASVQIIEISGRVLYRSDLPVRNNSVLLYVPAGIAAGLYWVKVRDGRGEWLLRLIIGRK